MLQSRDLPAIPETAPVFPLPNAVLFPHAVMPLHVFEPRYRQMVQEAMAGDGFLAIAQLQPGWEADYEGSPAFADVGCLGRMAEVSRTDDGRYYLKLVGLRKVAFEGIVRESPFRTARLRPLDETVPGEDDPEAHADLVRLVGACGVLVSELSDKPFPMVSIREGLPYETVVNSICYHVGLGPQVKQSLLEMNDLRARCRALTRLLEEHLQNVMLARDTGAGGGDSETVN